MLRRCVLKAVLGSVVGALTCAVLFPTRVEAQANFDSPYTLAQTYNAALRLVRVDMGLTVTEKDPGVAYVLFEYKSTESGARVVPGSIQMLDSGRGIKVVVQLGQMPRYHEQVLIDALAKKLRDEYGDPPPRSNRRDAPDAGPDASGPWSEST
jgi:hypothetical protein